MLHKFRTQLLCALIASAALVTACSSTQKTVVEQYDLGILKSTFSRSTTLSPVCVAEVSSPIWLDSTGMVYRLAYANTQQMRMFAHSRWAMPPARLLEQRLKAHLSLSGGSVFSPSDGVANLPLIRVDLEEFEQIFNQPTQSTARIAVRVSIVHDRKVIAQQRFSRTSPAATPDAVGGAAAMATASDALVGDIMNWLATRPLP